MFTPVFSGLELPEEGTTATPATPTPQLRQITKTGREDVSQSSCQLQICQFQEIFHSNTHYKDGEMQVNGGPSSPPPVLSGPSQGQLPGDLDQPPPQHPNETVGVLL